MQNDTARRLHDRGGCGALRRLAMPVRIRTNCTIFIDLHRPLKEAFGMRARHETPTPQNMHATKHA